MIVKFYATLRSIVGGKAVEIPVEPGATAKELLDAIIAKYPPLKKELFVNGRGYQVLSELGKGGSSKVC